MANTKISAETAATTPLTGTELVPGVQDGDNVSITTQDVADLVTLTSLGGVPITQRDYGQLQANKNRLINGSFAINQRAAASNADDTYCLDRWYVLTQTGTVAVAQQTLQENGAPTSIRITQSQASAQRMGIAQIIEGSNCRDLRAAITTLSGRVRLSTTANLRYAVLEWTGTVDSVTSDVVNDWTGATYTAGDFFISTTTTVLAVGQVSCTAATWRALPDLNATLSASANNIIVLIWTEGTVAQNVTLDVSRVQWEPGAVSTPFEQLSVAENLRRCQRYFQVASYGAAGRAGSSTTAVVGAPFPVTMRGNPTVAIVNTSCSMRVNGASSTAASGAAIVDSGAGVEGYFIRINGFTGLTTADTLHCNSAGAFSFTSEL